MIVQIYGTWTLEDALELVEMGVDHLGLEIGGNTDSKVDEIIPAVRGKTIIVLLPLFTDLDRIAGTVEQYRPDIVHLCSSEENIDPQVIKAFRERIYPTQIMQAIPVAPPAISDQFESLKMAKAFDPYVDYLLLDTDLGNVEDNPMPGWVGITGKTHDWSISRAIVEGCKTPVILAGGLDPENVADGIRKVKPWGVDSCTGLDLYRGKKDLPKCRAFIENARITAAEIGD